MPKSLLKRANTVGLILMLLVAFGCSSSPRIDGSSDESFKASVQAIAKSLPEERRVEFQKTLTGMVLLVAIAKKGDDQEIRKFFDGMTYDDLMGKAQELREKLQHQQ